MENETRPDSVRTKAEIREYVKGSFVALHKAVARIGEKNVMQQLQVRVTPPRTCASLRLWAFNGRKWTMPITGSTFAAHGWIIKLWSA
jgi:hypothetical protein